MKIKWQKAQPSHLTPILHLKYWIMKSKIPLKKLIFCLRIVHRKLASNLSRTMIAKKNQMRIISSIIKVGRIWGMTIWITGSTNSRVCPGSLLLWVISLISPCRLLPATRMSNKILTRMICRIVNSNRWVLSKREMSKIPLIIHFVANPSSARPP